MMPEKLSKELAELEDAQLIEFIRETVNRLHVVADYLETYVADEIPLPEVGFDTEYSNGNGADDEALPPTS